MTTTTLAGFRLSPQQKYLWKLQENNINYLAKCTIKIQGKVKVNILKSALEKILNRHDSFRTTFQRRPGIKMPIQVILDNGKIYWNHLNLSNFKSEKQTEQIGEILQNQNGLMAQLDQQPIFPTAFLTLSEEEHILLVSLPALIADSFTLNNLVKEISESYNLCCKESDFDEEAVQYLQFSEWQNELLEEKDAETEIAYWQNRQFQSVNLPFENSHFESEKFTPEEYSLNLDPNVIAKLEANILPNITIDNFLLGCWQTLLWRLTKQSDITVKTVFSGRQYEDLEEVMGLLAKSLPISCQLQGDLKFTQLLEEISDRFEEASERQEYFINSETEPPAMGFEFIDISNIYYGGDLSFSLENQSVIFDNFKVKLNCIKTQESITAEFQYNSELINIDVIKSFAKQFETLVTSTVENLNAGKLHETSLSKLNIFSESESNRLLNELNKTEQNYPQDKLIHQIFESQAERTPNDIAVVFEEQKLTYAELNSQANQLAHYLQKIGVEADTIVGVFMERSLEIIIAILAILKAGGAYLPIDTKLPEKNLAFRLEDAGVNILLSQSEIAPKNLERDIKIIDVFQKLEIGNGEEKTENTEDLTSTLAKNPITTINQQPQTNPSNNVTAENLAYILYTSGSTGKPKGVAIEHRQILNYLRGIQEKLQISSIATSAIVSTFAADLGNTVIFPTLCSGGCLHIISQECASDATALADYCQRHPIDYLKIVPSHLSALLTSNPSPYLLPRQCLILGGEAATWDLIAKIQQHSPQCRILNHYGPTETTVGVLTYAVNDENNYNTKTVPIGRPLANTQVYVLDEKLQPVSVGVPGELYIGGAGLARGYFNRPELTDEKFISGKGNREQGTGNRLYKTGDLVRYLPDGNIEFLGRIDNQVKIRGFRIELGEIETAIASHPEIQTAVVIARENNSGNKRLIAYFVPTKKQFSPNNLRQFLQDKLADYAIPSNFVKLEFLPLTLNGKIDRKALPDPDNIRPELENNFVAPRNPTESLLANIWSELLGVEKIGIHDNFFELGGHSLLATQLISQIRETFQIKIPLKTLFDFPTIIKLGPTIEEILQTGVCDQEKIDFNAEAILDQTILPQTTISQNIVKPQNILLTGVTGFVGAYLLDELLRQTSANIYCLIRETNPDSAKQKLRNQLESYLLWDETFSSRIIPVVGDLSSQFFGLSTEQFNHLASQIDVIYHSGAWVNHIYPYSVLKPTNVLGTQEILRLASEINVKPVHFISTIGVLPSSSNSENTTILESDYLTETPNIKSGYQQSKWVAEKLVMTARDRGIPTCIYRLPMITGDTNTGVSNINDRICRQIKGCIQLGMVPILESKLVDNWVPVNNISQAIVHLSQQENSLGKAFHLMNPAPTSFNNLFDWIYSLDSSVKKVSLNDWITELSSHPENVLYPYLFKLEFQIEKSTDKQSYTPSRIIDTQNTKDGLLSSNISLSSIDYKYLETMVSYLGKSGFLNLPS
ncbi:MAG: amino acid adenylation domain-containing protein [Okeania sp. SIO2F4]|uniref:non-ribosomal peptide synthetase n=1 Tax=Okeania sp. SIO2F4 TaxID=2607790 RepID=UPI00142D0B7C|nr:non-ribosomal peptide synthetase [Okeania sp. SIO2F4]NES06780.1 amino acid adenylation domain-containing protein [Okeania sp. SIO2F4]